MENTPMYAKMQAGKKSFSIFLPACRRHSLRTSKSALDIALHDAKCPFVLISRKTESYSVCPGVLQSVGANDETALRRNESGG